MDARDPLEKKMFGGIGFMVEGKLAIAASGQGGALVRVDPAEAGELCAGDGVERMEMRGKPMNGWLRVAANQLEDARDLKAWIDRGVAAAASA